MPPTLAMKVAHRDAMEWAAVADQEVSVGHRRGVRAVFGDPPPHGGNDSEVGQGNNNELSQRGHENPFETRLLQLLGGGRSR